jgi:hypothetical protein
MFIISVTSGHCDYTPWVPKKPSYATALNHMGTISLYSHSSTSGRGENVNVQAEKFVHTSESDQTQNMLRESPGSEPYTTVSL